MRSWLRFACATALCAGPQGHAADGAACLGSPELAKLQGTWVRAELLDRLKQDRPADAQDLLEELLDDGILVRKGRQDGQELFSFILRSFHELCLAGWIARESPPVKAKDSEAFQRMIRGRADAWDREDWLRIVIPESTEFFKPLNQPGWNNVWPLVGGQLQANILSALTTILPFVLAIVGIFLAVRLGMRWIPE